MKKYLIKIFSDAAKKLDYLSEAQLSFDIPKIETHGDFSCNVAMTLTKKLKKNPRSIAEEIISNLNYDDKVISKMPLVISTCFSWLRSG